MNEVSPGAEHKVTTSQSESATGRAELHRILLASAGQENAAGALRLAAELGRRHGAEVAVVTVYQPSIPLPLHEGEAPHVEPAQQHEIDSQNAMVRRQLAEQAGTGESWPLMSRIGEHGQRIAEEGTRWGADVIVLGLGRPYAGERPLGDRALLRVAYAADRPLLAVCPALDHLPTSVVLAVANNGESVRLARFVSAIAAEGAMVHLVHVREPDEAEEDVQRLEETLGPVEAELHGAGLQVQRQEIRRGDPMRRLMAYARRAGVELIAGGLHGDGFAARTVVRNIVLHLAAKSRCSVLLVPPAGA